MVADRGEPLRCLRVDGGAAANDLLMQFQCDLVGVPLSRPHMLETTALGAAMLAMVGVGVFDDLGTLREAWVEERRFSSAMSAPERDAAMARWAEGLRRV